MITIKQVQNNATVTDGSDTVTLGAGDSYTCLEPEEKLDFIFTVDTTIADNSPSDSYNLAWNGVVNALVNWGDGTEEYVVFPTQGIKSHQYLTEGVYDITVSGLFNYRPLFVSGVDKLKIIAVKQWGRTFTTLNNAFKQNNNLSSLPQNETLFFQLDSRQCFSSTSLSNFGKIDSSFLSNGLELFRNSNFDYNVGDWNVANCSTMTSMFLGTSMSQANCDNILVGWTRWSNGQANIQLQSNVSLHLGNTDYTRGGDAEDAFNYLVNTLNWTITFG